MARARGAEIGGGLFVIRSVRAAEEIGFVELAFAEHRRGGCHMNRLAAVRGAGEGDLFTGQIELFDSPVLEKRNGLQRLRGGAEAGARPGIAGVGEKRPSESTTAMDPVWKDSRWPPR